MKNVLIVVGSVVDSTKTSSGATYAATSPTKRIKHASGESTWEIGMRIKKHLENRGCSVRLIRTADCNEDCFPYDLIIIGSSIQGGVPLPGVKNFVETNRAVLQEKKVAVFAACLAVKSRYKGMRKRAESYADSVACGIIPVSKAVFAGKSPDMGGLLNLIGQLALGVKYGDHRDWGEIERWTMALVKD